MSTRRQMPTPVFVALVVAATGALAVGGAAAGAAAAIGLYRAQQAGPQPHLLEGDCAMTRIDHGTRRGFNQHKAVGGMPCEACREANNTYQREYMRANYDPAKRRAAYERRLATWGHA